jgi:hypothetical protein
MIFIPFFGFTYNDPAIKAAQALYSPYSGYGDLDLLILIAWSIPLGVAYAAYQCILDEIRKTKR